MKEKYQIGIGISALNESNNVVKLLNSIKTQKLNDCRLDKITLISDGSTDDTVNEAMRVKNINLEIIVHKKRMGKTFRMNEIFKSSKADIVIMLDADVVLKDPYTLNNLADPIIKGVATLTSGRPMKIKSDNLTDRVMDVSAYLQDQVKGTLNSGDNVYACHGRIVALARELYSKLALPMPTVGNDAYLYFYNKVNGSGFAFVNDANVIYKAPQNIRDFIKQQRRFSTTPKEQAKMFGQDILKEYDIPLKIKIRILINALVKYKLYLFIYLFYRLVSTLFAKESKSNWDVSLSTKSI